MHSFGFGGTGKFSNSGKFSDYGTKFSVGDTIVCAVDLENKPLASIGFSKNGKWLGVARRFDATSKGLGVVDTPLRDLPWESALFPHILLKNVVVQLQFSIEDGLVPEEGYKPWDSAIGDGNVIMGPPFASSGECEVLMMVGLPASGKTTWAEKWVKMHPEKRYVLLGTNLALDQMKVPGLLRKQNYGERFERLMSRATGIFNTLLARAAKTRRNYILDQTNVYKSARNRKLKAFVNYRKVAVVVFPPPNDLKFRAQMRFKEMGKEVPAEAVNEMIANYVLPMRKNMHGSNELFDEVIFTELGGEEAQRHLDEMKRSLGSPNLNQKRDFSPYSRESSVQSFSTPYVADKVAATATGGHWPTSQSTVLLPGSDNLNTLQFNAAAVGLGSSGGYRPRRDNSNLLMPNDSPYESVSNYGRTSFHGDVSNPYGSYVASNPYNRNTYERTSVPMGNMSPYPTHSAIDAFGRPNFEGPSSFQNLNYRYPSTSPSYRSPGAQLYDRGVPHVDHQALREPSYGWHPPVQNTYGSPYTDPRPRPTYGIPQNPVNPRPDSWYR
ncbi:heterogeneous nuclear ribonucleoprotein U-like protein 1 isoform X2 [Phoenix dactylifera]|nr:heterogeneous nuclear ribonucleoprotein U-like protein 1 isoform X2 [Phoenix dactylifera]